MTMPIEWLRVLMVVMAFFAVLPVALSMFRKKDS